MPAESFNFEEITAKRRAAIEDSIRAVSVDEVKGLGEELFPFPDHPWREVYFKFVAENANNTIYHAVTHDRVHIIYGRATDQGMWFMPGSGRGPLRATGLQILREIVGKL